MAFYAYLLPFLAVLVQADVDLTMYQENYFQKGGAYLTMQLYNACTDVLPEFDNLVNSVEINGCAMVCKDPGCKGDCIKLQPGVPSLPNLSSIGYGGVISSVKDCTPELPPVVVEKRTKATLYEHANYGGDHYDIDFEGSRCVNVNSYFNDKASSVDAHGTCIVLCQHGNCGGRCERLEPMATHPNTKSIHESLVNLNFNDEISSVKDCTTELPPILVTLYEHANYKGATENINLEGSNCVNVRSNFNDKASSVDAHGNCVVLCQHGNCGGRCERLEPMSTHPNTKNIHEFLGNIGFNDEISSVKACH